MELYLLWLTSNEWMKRRVETAQILGPKSLRRRVSIDMLPPTSSSAGRSVVPITILKKAPLVSFDITDEAGTSIPIFNRMENGKAAWSMLSAAAKVEVAPKQGDASPPPLADDLLADLREIVFASFDDGLDVLKQFAENQSTVARQTLTASPHLMALARTLCQHFLLLTSIEQPSVRRILKFTYEESMGRVGKRRDRLVETMGWRAARFEFAVPALDEAESFHFELAAPEGLEVVHAKLSVYDSSGHTSLKPAEMVGKTAHLYTQESRAGLDGTASVWLGLQRSGLLRSGFIVAVANTALLALLAVVKPDPSSTDAATTLLLTLPALLATFIVRPGEHGLVSDLLLGVRSTVAVNGGAAYLGALLLALGVEPAFWGPWGGAIALATISTLSLLRSMFPKEIPEDMRSW